MFDTITNLPWHPLVVHAAIVLIPLSCLGAVLVAAKGAWNRLHGFLVLISSFIATGAAFVAKESGEQLASRVGLPAGPRPGGAPGSCSRPACCSCRSRRCGGSTAAARCARRP